MQDVAIVHMNLCMLISPSITNKKANNWLEITTVPNAYVFCSNHKQTDKYNKTKYVETMKNM